MKNLQKECYDYAVSKGFDVNSVALNSLLGASEVQEMLDHVKLNVSPRANPFFREFKKISIAFKKLMNELDKIRYEVHFCDNSTIKNEKEFDRELADYIQRGLTMAEMRGLDVTKAIRKKIKENINQPNLHGKKF